MTSLVNNARIRCSSWTAGGTFPRKLPLWSSRWHRPDTSGPSYTGFLGGRDGIDMRTGCRWHLVYKREMNARDR